MSKRKLPSKKARQAARARASATAKASEKDKDGEKTQQAFFTSSGIRETIESVVVAFVLAFLFRTFEAEAFVIPTGSMAPTLMGRHKDIECPHCGYTFPISASEEVDSNSGSYTGRWVNYCECPMCRAELPLGAGESVLEEHPSYSGDRILVNKFAYHVSDPKRWDVAVFRYPCGAQTNYIKRIVGLPGETLRISNGDLYIGQTADEVPEFEIARKPPRKLQAMLQPVFDNNLMPRIAEHGFSDRWRVWPASGAGWQVSDDHRAFTTDGSAVQGTWLRYEHRLPSSGDWEKSANASAAGREINIDPDPQLIHDLCLYNSSAWQANVSGNPSYDRNDWRDPKIAGAHWVGDLAVQCTVDIESDSGEMIFELVEGGWAMQCGIDVADGTATLTIHEINSLTATASTLDGRPYRLTAQTAIRGPGQHEILFSNVDDQLRLWVDGELVEFGGFDEATCYLPLLNTEPDDYDLAPVGIASQGAAMRVSDLQVKRDVYYENLHESVAVGFGALPPRDPFVHTGVPYSEFPLEEDQFFALGDNSPKSMDSRLWRNEKFVHRDLLIGKAFFIYWPDTHYKVPLPKFSLPFFPNFSDMGFVR